MSYDIEMKEWAEQALALSRKLEIRTDAAAIIVVGSYIVNAINNLETP